MNETTGLIPTNARPLKWRWRHKELYYHLTLYAWMVGGGLPGIATLIIMHLCNDAHRLGLIPTVGLAVLAYAELIWGLLLGALVGCALLLAEKAYLPEPGKEKGDA